MKTKFILIILLVILSLILISLKIFQSSNGPHGGTVKKADEYHYIELKNPGSSLYAFLLDQDRKPVSNKGINCRATLFYSDNTNSDMELEHFGADGFFIALVPRYYVSCALSFNVSGKDISAKFENETLFVNKK